MLWFANDPEEKKDELSDEDLDKVSGGGNNSTIPGGGQPPTKP